MSEQVYDILKRVLHTKLLCSSCFKDPFKKNTNYSVSFTVEIQSNSVYLIQANAGPVSWANGAD